MKVLVDDHRHLGDIHIKAEQGAFRKKASSSSRKFPLTISYPLD